MYDIILVIHTLLVLFLIGMVLIQRSDSDGLGGLGGGGGNQFMTGRGAANMMTRTTAILAGCFMLTSLVLATMIGRSDQGSVIDKIDAAVPAAVESAFPDAEQTKKPATSEESTAPKPE